MTPRESLSPALAAWVDELNRRTTWDFAQVRVRASEGQFELCHVADSEFPVDRLRSVAVGELRMLAQTTVAGAFRPIKTAPNLQSGWRCVAKDLRELGEALEGLYPGAVVDWWAAQSSNVPVQSYRDFTNRQTGMYRITQQLTDSEAAAVISSGCAVEFCMRHRLWSVDGLAPDSPGGGKSEIPCLEPCPVQLEFARRGRRLVQAREEAPAIKLAPDEVATLLQALNHTGAEADPPGREGDLADPLNPRRIRLLRDRLAGLLPGSQPIGHDT